MKWSSTAVSAASPHTASGSFQGLRIGAGKHLVRGVVAGEDFLHGIPLQFPSQLDGDVAQVADRRHAMADVHGEVRILAALDAVQKVAVFARRIRVEVDFVGSDDGFQDLVRAGLQASAPAAITDPAVACR